MRKYNRRILTALVVAYKKGIISRKPLNRWLNIDRIFYRILKYMCYLMLLSILFIIFDKKIFTYFNLNDTVIIYGYIIEKTRLVSAIVLGIIGYNFYRLFLYLNQVYIVKNAMKNYQSEDGDIEKINNITYKIHV